MPSFQPGSSGPQRAGDASAAGVRPSKQLLVTSRGPVQVPEALKVVWIMFSLGRKGKGERERRKANEKKEGGERQKEKN